MQSRCADYAGLHLQENTLEAPELGTPCYKGHFDPQWCPLLMGSTVIFTINSFQQEFLVHQTITNKIINST